MAAVGARRNTSTSVMGRFRMLSWSLEGGELAWQLDGRRDRSAGWVAAVAKNGGGRQLCFGDEDKTEHSVMGNVAKVGGKLADGGGALVDREMVAELGS